jgi:hypothetical protein
LRTTSASTTTDTVLARYVCNEDNQVCRRMAKTDSTSHTYAGGAYRAWNGDTTHKVEFLDPDQPTSLPEFHLQVSWAATAGSDGGFSLGLNTATGLTAFVTFTADPIEGGERRGSVSVALQLTNSPRYRYISVNEYSSGLDIDFSSYALAGQVPC